jgi:chromosome partitioning protein
MTVLALTNQKGGVGKTTTAVNLAACLAVSGQRVLLIDLDPQANATSGLGQSRAAVPSTYEVLLGQAEAATALLHARPNLDLLPATVALAGAEVELVAIERREFRLRTALQSLRGNYDYVLIDCPPSLGLLTVNALVAADSVIVPVQCEYFALEGLARLISTIDVVRKGLNPSLRLNGLVMTMYDPRVNLARQVVQEVQTHFPSAYRTLIPRSVRLSEAPSQGRPIIEYDSSSRAANAYREFAAEVLARR